MTNIRRISFLILFSLLIAACAPVEPGVPVTGEEDPLLGTQWNLERLNDKPVIEGATVSIQFEQENDVSRLSGSAGCNSYSGEYTVDGSQIEVGEIIATLIACPEPENVMEQESEYLRVLRQEVSGFELNDNRLTMQNQAGETILEYTRN
jgi:heat shock protein HslJ